MVGSSHWWVGNIRFCNKHSDTRSGCWLDCWRRGVRGLGRNAYRLDWLLGIRRQLQLIMSLLIGVRHVVRFATHPQLSLEHFRRAVSDGIRNCELESLGASFGSTLLGRSSRGRLNHADARACWASSKETHISEPRIIEHVIGMTTLKTLLMVVTLWPGSIITRELLVRLDCSLGNLITVSALAGTMMKLLSSRTIGEKSLVVVETLLLK